MVHKKKEQERAALHATIWEVLNKLRGTLDGWDSKEYVLGILFYRFISENLSSYVNEKQKEAGEQNFNYASLNDNVAKQACETILDEKGFFIYPSELFENVKRQAPNDSNLNETLEKVFKNIESSAQDTDNAKNMKGLFDDIDVNSNKLGASVIKRNEKLANLLNAIGDLKLGSYANNSIDLFGDAYEYLIGMYAAYAGKKGGEFFTPQEVSQLLAQITVVGKKEVNKVYDPACGSGSLLLKFAKVLGKENVRKGFFGQESNITTYNLCRINMFLHDINYDQFDIAHGNTLTDPKHWDDEPFEAIVSNPPYSIAWEGKSNPLLINDERFTPAGVLAPKSKADLAFVMHCLSWLATSGTAVIVISPGVLSRSRVEQKIREYLVDNNYIDAVIQLPGDLFFGTTIATCILVLKKNKVDSRVLFIDATNEFVRRGAKNKLSESNAKKILECYTKRADIKYFSSVVNHEELKEKDYNLSVEGYVVPEDKREKIDIKELNASIKSSVERQNKLRREIDAIVADFRGGGEMSKIDDLLAKYCPSGVEYISLSKTCTLSRGRVMSKDYLRDNAGDYPVYSSQTANKGIFGKINTYDFDGTYITWTTDGANAGSVFYHDREKFSITNVCGLISNNLPEKINLKFLYYVLSISSKNYVSSGMGNPKLMSNVMSTIKIPIPPLKIQEEIVRILDNFTELETELETDLEARKKQYEHYRNKLLTFK